MKGLWLIFLIPMLCQGQKQEFKTPFEQGNGNQSATYAQTIAWYENLGAAFETISVQTRLRTDSGEPLHLVLFDSSGKFTTDSKITILVNNGIHAGEPDGIDASMLFMRDLATGKITPPKNVMVAVIPVYNIGGMLNRNATTRVNQDGPEEYGFRGNARNYDLNRDFIKADTNNTLAFADIFQGLSPDIFIDNHVSNGADYQYTLTYILTQQNRLGQTLGGFLHNEMMPELTRDLKRKKIVITPYVNAWGEKPDARGFAQFNDTPRYATGYTSLFNTIGFVVETHMLKPFKDRVKATYDFMASVLEYANSNAAVIKQKRLENAALFKAGNLYPVQWAVDSAKVSEIEFLGFEGSYKKSEVTTGQRLFYDRSKPFKRKIPFYGEYKPVKTVTIPNDYIIPQGWQNVIQLLVANGVQIKRLSTDSVAWVERYRIKDFKTSVVAYEGHYPHQYTSVEKTQQEITFRKGDYVVPTNQPAVKYIMETLEPEAADSFFNWNFFDTILQEKEWFSDYVFEDLAVIILRDNPNLKTELDQKIKNEAAFASDPDAQLAWIYQHSIYYESAHMS
ncbi:MAG: hypothetical protein EOO01_14270, partial [Chitinophagaceae bacterium]